MSIENLFGPRTKKAGAADHRESKPRDQRCDNRCFIVRADEN